MITRSLPQECGDKADVGGAVCLKKVSHHLEKVGYNLEKVGHHLRVPDT
jgi:hypothetical protein